MADDEATDEPSSELPESVHEDAKPAEDATSTDGSNYSEDSLKNYGILDLMNAIYNDRYYWDILKSAVMFVLALKVARECNMMRIPMKEYRPFTRH